ncbi:30S ribosomal protein S6e [Candidatus Micrarchaeota archaeon]|nr:30S ribosomal protein S6e [Candidatus Micrarchaeota archaeon]
MKVVVAGKNGSSFQGEVEKGKESSLYSLKIGDSFDGGLVGAVGYTLQVTGGSDKDGVPMRKDVSGQRRASVLLSSGAGFKSSCKGDRAKRKVRGNTVSDNIVQLNTKIVSEGEKKLEELFPKKEGEKKDKK